jgi:lipopolysaccharide/colanic/teichoic acid biosynthesis glycosyltransferase
MNVAIASIALVILSPLMLVIAFLIAGSTPGPIFYSQTRVGIDRRRRGTRAIFDRRHEDQGGITFTIYKFRTMYVDAERHSGAVWAIQNDPRVTAIGRVLRRSRLDELPQLFNVIMGDMNIVGPRPERPSIFKELRQDIVEYPIRQRARPGITGLAQVNHRYDMSVDDVRIKVQYDIEYLRRQSLTEDVKIMARTVPVMLFSKEAW